MFKCISTKIIQLNICIFGVNIKSHYIIDDTNKKIFIFLFVKTYLIDIL